MHHKETTQHPVDDSESEAFYAVLVLFIEQREGLPNNLEYKWREKNVAYIRYALSVLNEQQRNDFFRRFKDFQITKILEEPISSNL